jgi:hypothetical protein
MEILKVTYIENGYFIVKYNIGSVVQDITAIQMTVPTSEVIKDILLFLRQIKIEKLKDKDFDELRFRNYIINNEELLNAKRKNEDMLRAMKNLSKF